jgi:hypothetical protein
MTTWLLISSFSSVDWTGFLGTSVVQPGSILVDCVQIGRG